MSQLFNTLPEGCTHLQSVFSQAKQRQIVAECRKLLRTHPLATPSTARGHPLALQVSSWGKVGWWGGNGTYQYLEHHPYTQEPWPPIPDLIMECMQFALAKSGYDDPVRFDTVLLNWYPPNTGKLGKHQDVTEEDLISPIVTLSLGDSCVFNIGSENYEHKGTDITLISGDVVVMAGESRLAYHEVKRLIPTEDPLFSSGSGGRISLTARKVFL